MQKLAAGSLLVNCLRTRFGGALDPGAFAVAPAAWAALPAEATRQSVAPLLYERLRALEGIARPPAPVTAALRQAYIRSAFRNAIVFRELGAAATELQRRGIDVIGLKGVHLATQIWDDPAIRGMADIDLLVSLDRLAEAEEALVGLGYGPPQRPDIASYVHRTNHIAPFKKPGAVSIEVHWTIERPTSPFRIDPAALWERSRPARIGDVELRVLGDEDLLLHLALHVAYHHRFARAGLKASCDIAAVLAEGQPDLSRLADSANAAGAGKFVYTALALARDLLAAPIPAGALDRFEHGAEDDRVVGAARHFVVTPPEELPVTFQEMGAGRSPGDKLLRFLHGVFPEPARVREIYKLPTGSRRVALFYLFRPLDLALRRGRVGLALLFRSRRLRPTLTWEENRHFISRWVDEAAES